MAPPGEADYRALLALGHQKMEGAAEVCQKLSATHRLFIVTNGVVGTQERRLRDAGLYGFFSRMSFTPKSSAARTPIALFFDYVAAHIPGFEPASALLIGNSPATDIKGGRDYGIDTCLYCPPGKSSPADIPATYTIHSLWDLPALC